MLDDATRSVMRDVLCRQAASSLKIRALSNLHDMMQVCPAPPISCEVVITT